MAQAKRVKLKFSPSASYRWLNCPGALQLCATLPVPASSKHAMEGTAAHELASNCLETGAEADEWIGEEIEVEDKIFKVTENMAENVQIYLDAVRNDLTENGISTEELDIEKKFKLELATGDVISGTNDASFSSPLGELYVYDYKHGQGTYVEVVDNSQLKLYAVGAMEKAGWVNESAEIVIAQPRFRSEDLAPVRRWEITKADLITFVLEVTRAVTAAKEKNAPLVPGEWCSKTFCPAFAVCPAVRSNAVAVVDETSTALTFPDPGKLTPEQVIKVLDTAGMISDWVKSVKSYAEEQAKSFGMEIPGYKLVQKTGNRAWTDEMVVENEFEHEFGDKIYDKKLKSPAQIEKIVGKERVKDLTMRPDRGLALVPEKARGEAVTTRAGQIFKKIEEVK